MCNTDKAILIFTGSELTQGKVEDKHLVFLGQELKKRGIYVQKVIFVPDQDDSFKNELNRDLSLVSIVIITGGLGPTSDDLTREVVGEVAGVPLVFNESVWQSIKKP